MDIHGDAWIAGMGAVKRKLEPRESNANKNSPRMHLACGRVDGGERSNRPCWPEVPVPRTAAVGMILAWALATYLAVTRPAVAIGVNAHPIRQKRDRVRGMQRNLQAQTAGSQKGCSFLPRMWTCHPSGGPFCARPTINRLDSPHSGTDRLNSSHQETSPSGRGRGRRPTMPPLKGSDPSGTEECSDVSPLLLDTAALQGDTCLR